MVFHNEDGNPARANIKQALGYLKDGDGDGNSQPHKGVKASANSDVMYFFTSAQDGDPSQDDVRLCLGDDLKKAQDHSQRQAGIEFEGLGEEVVPKVDDVSLVDEVFNGAFSGDGEEDVVMGEGVVVTSSSLEMLTKSCLGGMMQSEFLPEKKEVVLTAITELVQLVRRTTVPLNSST
ncbi:hypothetical protein Tco_1575531 [Tanacetum coccineum]